LIARKSGEEWYVAAMTDGSPRELNVDLSFLSDGEWEAVIYRDGINANRYGSDYKKEVISLSRQDELEIKLASGGGWVARIYPRENQR
jgi:alpha-glucosidase